MEKVIVLSKTLFTCLKTQSNKGAAHPSWLALGGENMAHRIEINASVRKELLLRWLTATENYDFPAFAKVLVTNKPKRCESKLQKQPQKQNKKTILSLVKKFELQFDNNSVLLQFMAINIYG